VLCVEIGCMSSPSVDYERKDALQRSAYVGLQSGGVGLVVSAVKNALETHPAGASGVITRTGGTIGFFAAMGALFAFTEASVANARAKDDALNGATGACAAGFLAGIRARSIPTAFAGCAILGGIIGTFDLAGRSLTGGARDFETPKDREERRLRFFKKPKPLAAEAQE